jgi:hypothetical protein
LYRCLDIFGGRSSNETGAREEFGLFRKSLAAAMILLLPATAHAVDKVDLREAAVKQVGEVIALASLCRGLRPNVETISLVLMRAGVGFDDIIDDAGKYSENILPKMAASGGEEAACAAGSAWYGPRGSKAPDFMILQ